LRIKYIVDSNIKYNAVYNTIEIKMYNIIEIIKIYNIIIYNKIGIRIYTYSDGDVKSFHGRNVFTVTHVEPEEVTSWFSSLVIRLIVVHDSRIKIAQQKHVNLALSYSTLKSVCKEISTQINISQLYEKYKSV